MAPPYTPIVAPLLGGAFVGAGLGIPWGFYAFGLVGLMVGITVSLVPVVRRRKSNGPRPETAGE